MDVGLTRDEFIEWRNNRTTQKIIQMVTEKISEKRKELAKRAGLNALADRWDSGLYQGMEIAVDYDFLFEWEADKGETDETVESPGT